MRLSLLLSALLLTAVTLCPFGVHSLPTAPLQLLKLLANLPPDQQEIILEALGGTLQVNLHSDCNIFGGTGSCKPLPSNSTYLAQCPGADARVDCALWGNVQNNIYNTPADDLEAYLTPDGGSSSSLKELCPACFERINAFWCAQAVPRCGSFKAYVHTAVLPALTSVMAAYNKGASQMEAVSEAVDQAFTTMSLVLPCREMCQQLTATCDCGGTGQQTFGDLYTYVTAAADRRRVAVPAGMSYVMFSTIWNKPFCDLFAPSTEHGFAGRCDTTPAQCTRPDAWCSAVTAQDANFFKFTQGVLLLELVQAVAGWIVDPQIGLWQNLDMLTRRGNKDVDDAVDKYAPGAGRGPAGAGGAGGISGRGHGGMPAGQVAGIVVLSVVLAALLGGFAWQGFKVYQQRRQDVRYLELQQADDYKLDTNF